jgi:hypothetical protein
MDSINNNRKEKAAPATSNKKFEPVTVDSSLLASSPMSGLPRLLLQLVFFGRLMSTSYLIPRSTITSWKLTKQERADPITLLESSKLATRRY